MGRTKIPTEPRLGMEIDEKVLEAHWVDGQEFFDPGAPVCAVKDAWKDRAAESG